MAFSDPHAPDHPEVAKLRRRLLDLAAAGHRMPIGADLVLHEKPDPHGVMHDARQMGEVILEAADRYETPIALPLMDLRLEKSDLLQRLGVAAEEVDQYHFAETPSDAIMQRAAETIAAPFDRRGRANLGAIRFVAEQAAERGDLIPCGMAIGPFSLMTKLLADPITPVALAGMGLPADAEPDVAMAERTLELARGTVARSLKAQIEAGARAVCVCEPAANTMFLSPNMISAGADVFERYVMQPNLAVAAQLNDGGVGLIFHDCGELIDPFVADFAQRLHPVLLSLGSPRNLWEDARLCPDDVVLYGNLPSKRFYSDSQMPTAAVEQATCELIAKMKPTGKPFILGSECDVLSVAGSHETIAGKVERMLSVPCR